MGKFKFGADIRTSPLYDKEQKEVLKEEAPEVEIKKRGKKSKNADTTSDSM